MFLTLSSFFFFSFLVIKSFVMIIATRTPYFLYTYTLVYQIIKKTYSLYSQQACSTAT